ncbi:MAG TPA: chemotaxis-specific protein-glutamate methyltransferase CheB [Longimicrobiaceae bacterium]|nr:chemotaxis-specific protein-glutamate methyltransferase CheB [Longimicrobiaceae bacterium]
MIRVLVAEDSPTARALLIAILRGDPEISVVGVATNGREAVEMTARLKPDLVTMDVHMPELDGLGATEEIMANTPTPILIVTSAARDDAALSLSATEAGALMLVPKPQGPGSPRFTEESAFLVQMVKAMARVRVVRRRPTRPSPPRPVALPPRRGPRLPRVLAVGASTGGPAALHHIFGRLPAGFPLPILVVQHMARGFTTGLASWLDGGTPLRVKIPERGETLAPGTVYLAPDDRHLGLRGEDSIELSSDAAVGLFRPSATYLFRSVADAVGARSLALVLTGMGDDGVAGLVPLAAAGGRVLAQDEESSVVFGMAREAVRAGLAGEVLPLERIAPRLVELATENAHG